MTERTEKTFLETKKEMFEAMRAWAKAKEAERPEDIQKRLERYEKKAIERHISSRTMPRHLVLSQE